MDEKELKNTQAHKECMRRLRLEKQDPTRVFMFVAWKAAQEVLNRHQSSTSKSSLNNTLLAGTDEITEKFDLETERSRNPELHAALHCARYLLIEEYGASEPCVNPTRYIKRADRDTQYTPIEQAVLIGEKCPQLGDYLLRILTTQHNNIEQANKNAWMRAIMSDNKPTDYRQKPWTDPVASYNCNPD
jgi:hypothetical protein